MTSLKKQKEFLKEVKRIPNEVSLDRYYRAESDQRVFDSPEIRQAYWSLAKFYWGKFKNKAFNFLLLSGDVGFSHLFCRVPPDASLGKCLIDPEESHRLALEENWEGLYQMVVLHHFDRVPTYLKLTEIYRKYGLAHHLTEAQLRKEPWHKYALRELLFKGNQRPLGENLSWEKLWLSSPKRPYFFDESL